MEFKYDGAGFDHPSLGKSFGSDRMPDSMKTKLAVKSILDRWVACAISIGDAETELRDLFASKIEGGVSGDVGALHIETKGPTMHSFTMNGQPLLPANKLILIFEGQRIPRLIIETRCVPASMLAPIATTADKPN